MTDADGTLATDDEGTPMLRFERRFPHPIAKVWRALSDATQLLGWFPQTVTFDPDLRVGAKVRYSDDPHLPGETFHGEVLALDPPRLLELTWGTDRLRMELREDGDGTVLVFTDTFAERDHAARDGAGWHVCLDDLAGALDGRPRPAFDEPRWKVLHDEYAERFGIPTR